MTTADRNADPTTATDATPSVEVDLIMLVHGQYEAKGTCRITIGEGWGRKCLCITIPAIAILEHGGEIVTGARPDEIQPLHTLAGLDLTPRSSPEQILAVMGGIQVVVIEGMPLALSTDE